ncbi:hypothetical protein H845_133 [Komagataeibacter xylinus E25]|nr:hypothetical protein H845_133 [Komagataeibacter xylinus E25]
MTRGRRLLRLHFITHENAQDGLLTAQPDGTYKSGAWGKMRKILPQVIGAAIHLHENQQAESWCRGRITAWEHAENHPGRITFTFMPDKTIAPATTRRWGMEQTRVWDDCDSMENT